ncbi:MAG: Ig-like domain-containing protein [Bacillota bacterium]|nr:Ig-like domain-containing protein [Bacillota bacterium]
MNCKRQVIIIFVLLLIVSLINQKSLEAFDVLSTNISSESQSVDGPITITFDRNLSKESLTTSNIYLRKNDTIGTTENIPIRVSYVDTNRTLTIMPLGKLEYDTYYTVTLSYNVRDMKGSSLLSNNRNFTFATERYEPTEITATFSQGVNNFPVTGRVVLNFSENMNTSTLTEANIFIRKAGSLANIPVNLEYSSSGRTLTITLRNALDPDTSYFLYVSNRVKDAYGHALVPEAFKFATEPGQAVKLVSYYPEATELYQVDGVITATFSGALNYLTITKENISIQSQATNEKVNIQLSYDPYNYTVTITPLEPLQYNTKYKVQFTNSIKYWSGDSIDPISWEFGTLFVPPLKISSIDTIKTKDNLTSFNSTIRVNFSEPMATASINRNNILISDKYTGAKVPFSVTFFNNNQSLLIRPLSPWLYGATYNIQFNDSIKTQSGLNLRPSSYEFTVEPYEP